MALHPRRWATNQVKMVATKVCATTVPKTLDIAATLVLLLYLLFIGLRLISPLYSPSLPRLWGRLWYALPVRGLI